MNQTKYLMVMFTIFISHFSINVYSQKIKGVVVNEFNQPLEAAYVLNLVSKEHTHTSKNGVFNITNTNIGDSLRIGILGYKTKIINLKTDENFLITLEEKPFQLEEIVIAEELNTISTISRMDLKVNPVNSSQEILRKIPGLFIGQHGGGGKAEQIFLRGFDIDHGTDVAISVDGMPVNMVSHAHGQGYSDLHFVIPETINKIDFGKGAYYADKGDFNTAGYVSFNTKDYVKESSISVTTGQFDMIRTLGLFNLLKNSKNQNAYIATEYIVNDGPFESPQNFNRFNLFGKYIFTSSDNEKLSLIASHFTSRWDASGQIPQREVDNGHISRFGAIDDTEGGETERTNFNLAFSKYINDNTRLDANAFYSHYAFELFSNFTFFLEDPINGDQIKQKENRNVFGSNASINYKKYLDGLEFNLNAGLSVRYDISKDVELSKTLNRKTTLENIKLGDINQTNISAFAKTDFDFGKFKISPALRLDYFKFLYNDELQTNYETKSKTKTVFSPKLNFFYDLKDNTKLYLKSGIGFHSNDARVVIANQKDILPKSYGTDLGLITKISPKLIVNSALWYLFLEQEFVYVGDAGVVEPSGETKRYGLDLGLRYQINKWLFVDNDFTITNAKSINEPDGQDYIPLAPEFTATGGISVKNFNNFSGGLRFRYLGDRAANSDNSIVADGYLVTDFNINYKINKLTLGLAVENIFDVDWNETQFATESRLQNEAISVEEIHFTPGTPFFAKGSITYNF